MSSVAYRTKVRAEPARRTVRRQATDGFVLSEVVLDPEIFGLEPNVAVMHQVVTAQLAAARSGTHSTRTRAEVSGGGSKPFRQKGTGRSRQGSIRAPQWSGGGVAMGPKPRNYRQRTPKKMVRLALCSALSDRAALNRVALVDQWDFEAPRTKAAVVALEALGLEGRVLVVTGQDDWVAERCFANLPLVDVVPASELNAYDVLRSDWVVFTDETVPGEVETVPGSEREREPVESGQAGDEPEGSNQDDVTEGSTGEPLDTTSEAEVAQVPDGEDEAEPDEPAEAQADAGAGEGGARDGEVSQDSEVES